MDISKFFASVDRPILKQMIARKITCKRTLWLINLIIDSLPGEKGLPLGNLTSQLFANIYMNELDYFTKHELKEKYYIRYMDDFLVFSDSKTHLKTVLKIIKKFLSDTLKLKLNNKTQLLPVPNQAVDFLGYRIYPTHRLIRNDSKRRIKRKIKKWERLYKQGKTDKHKLTATLAAWKGHCRHADANGLVESIKQKANLT